MPSVPKRLTTLEEQERARISEQGAAIATLKADNEKLSAVESENTELKAKMEVFEKGSSDNTGERELRGTNSGAPSVRQ